MWRIAIFSVSPSPHLTPLITTKTIREKKNYELSDTGQLFRLVREIFNINIIKAKYSIQITGGNYENP